jgi:RNA polymerase sigma factor (sigma-70 family)
VPQKNLPSDTHIEGLLEKVQKGAPGAREALLDHACERLLRLTRKMLGNYPNLRRWEQTDDVFQNSMLKLHRCLEKVELESVRHFFNLAAVHIRRELIDLSRHHFGPEGIGKNHHTDQPAPDESGGSVHAIAHEPEDLAEWSEFHQRVDRLPEDEREIVNLLFYEGLQQDEAANVLGVSTRTVKRRWHAARVRLHRDLTCDEP